MSPSTRRAAVDAAALRALLCVAFLASLVLAGTALAADDPTVFVIAQNDAGAEDEEDFDPTTDSSSAEPPSDVEVIRIKGRGVAAIETDVPDSVTQFDAGEIAALGVTDISDLAEVTPNVEIRTAGATSPVFFIRGVGLSDFSANAAGAVAIYSDGVPINAPAMQLGLIFDLENVEILRGPQGKGANRNASAGVFKLISRKPTGELSAGLSSQAGNFGSQDHDGFVEVPIVEEILSARFSFRVQQRDGYMENGCAGAPPFSERFGVDDPGDLVVGPNGLDAAPGQLNPLYRGVRFCTPPGATGILNSAGETRPRGVKNNNPPPQEIRFGGGGQNVWSIVPGNLPKWVNDTNVWAARGMFRLQPPDLDMDWILKIHGSRRDQFSTAGQSIGTQGPNGGRLGCRTSEGYIERDLISISPTGDPCSNAGNVEDQVARHLDGNPWRGDFNRIGQTTLDVLGSALTGTWNLGPATLKTITGYDQYERFRDQDNDFSPDIIFESLVDDSAHQWFQELNVSGELAETPLRWNAGGFYLQESLESRNESITNSLNTDSIREYTQDLSSWAVYGDVSWDFLDDFTLAGGFRYQSQTSDLFFTIGFANSGAGVGQPRFNGSKTWSAPTGEISLTYRFNDAVSTYWKYVRGWKPGTWNTSAQRGRFVSAADPEQIDSFEFGTAGNWFDGNFFLRANFFYYNYTDKQEFVVDDEPGAPPTLRVINASGAENYGIEAEVRWQPLVGLLPSDYDGLMLTVRPAWLEATYLEFSTDIIRQIGTIGAIPIIQDFTGNQVQNAPQFSVTGTAEWTFDFGRWGAVIPRYDFSWRDDTFFDTNESRGSRNARNEEFLPKYAIGQKAFVIHNARVSYRSPEGNIEVFGTVRNIANLAYKQTAFDASAFSQLTVNFINVPRTWGVGVVFNW